MPVEGVEPEPDRTANLTRAAMLADPVVQKQMHTLELFGAAIERGDREAALAFLSPSWSRVERRRGPTMGPNPTREEYVDALMAGVDVGFRGFHWELLDHVGSRLLTSATWSSDGGFEVQLLVVSDFEDDNWHFRKSAHFDVDDRAAAVAYLRRTEDDNR